MHYRSYMDDRITVPHGRVADLTGRNFPETVMLAAENDIMTDAGPLVSAGDTVKSGQLVWESLHGEEHSVYSSVSGTVLSVFGSEGMTRIEISNDGLHTPAPDCSPYSGKLKDATKEDICSIARKAGIVEGSGIMEFLFEKLGKSPSRKDSLIIDCIGQNAYLPVPGGIARERCASMINGIKILMMATGARKAYVVAEDSGEGTLDHLRELASKAGFIRVFGLRSGRIDYPHRVTREMVRELTCDSAGEYEVFDPEACCDLFRAFSKGSPCISRTIAVGGDCIGRPGIITVPLGTRISDVIRISGGLTKKAGAVILGDPLSGEWVTDQNETVSKTTDAVYVLSEELLHREPAGPCIRCGKCNEACRYGVVPAYIVRNAGAGRHKEMYGAENCVGCGFCSYVCPCGIDIMAEIRRVKTHL